MRWATASTQDASSGSSSVGWPEVEDRPAPLEVLVRVRREWLDLFGRMCAAHLTGPLPAATGEWTEVRLRFAAVKAARTLLSFGANVEVVSPASVRADLAAVAAEVVDCYRCDRKYAGRTAGPLVLAGAGGGRVSGPRVPVRGQRIVQPVRAPGYSRRPYLPRPGRRRQPWARIVRASDRSPAASRRRPVTPWAAGRPSRTRSRVPDAWMPAATPDPSMRRSGRLSP